MGQKHRVKAKRKRRVAKKKRKKIAANKAASARKPAAKA